MNTLTTPQAPRKRGRPLGSVKGRKVKVKVKKIHLSQGIRGCFLNWTEKQWLDALDYMTPAGPGTQFKSVKVLKNVLLDHIASGKEVLPLGDCDNFNPRRGCMGHPAELDYQI
jgi:hypothetical protein